MTVTTQTSCKPSACCDLCSIGTRRYVETKGKEHRFFHHVYHAPTMCDCEPPTKECRKCSLLGRFEDCKDQTYERVTFGAYENKVKA